MKPAYKPRVVRCVPRQDGGYLIVLPKGETAVSAKPLSEGASVTVQNGRVVA